MILDMNKLDEAVLPHFHGGEKEFHTRMFSDPQNKFMCGKLEPGASIGLHTHETNSEILYILSGSGTALSDGGVREAISQGLCHYCPKGHAHGLINDSDADLVFFAVVPEQ